VTALLTVALLFIPVGFGYWLGAAYGCRCDEAGDQ
jgi:hypothetical protein